MSSDLEGPNIPASTPSTDLQLSSTNPDEACRILAISSSHDIIKVFVESLRSLSSPSTSIESHPTSEQQLSGPITIPYTLSNRYYAADVHFALHTLESISPVLFSSSPSLNKDRKWPPAVVFIWVDGEPYAKNIRELSKIMELGGYEPEVSLAVRLPKREPVVDTTASISLANDERNQTLPETEDASDIDSTLMSFGFEYIDATIPVASHTSNRETDEEDAEISRLPRVLDALSTIMWPSMRARAASLNTKNVKSASTVLHERDEQQAIMNELLSVSGISGLSGREPLLDEKVETDEEDDDTPFSPYNFDATTGSMNLESLPPLNFNQKIAHEAQAWLVPEKTRELSGNTSKIQSTNAGDLLASPTDIDMVMSPFFGSKGVAHNEKDSKGNVSIGFEDDFTLFASAPSGPGQRPFVLDMSVTAFDTAASNDHEATSADSAHTTVATGIPTSKTTGGLTPASAGLGRLAYRSFGSVSDFGEGLDTSRKSIDGDTGYEVLEDGENWEDKDGDADDWEDEDGWEDEDDDSGLPSQDEIQAMARQIFGAGLDLEGPKNLSPSQEFTTSGSLFASAAASLSASSPSFKTKGSESASANNKAEGRNPASSSGPDEAMLERMRKLGSMAAMNDIAMGMSIMKDNAKKQAATRGGVPTTLNATSVSNSPPVPLSKASRATANANHPLPDKDPMSALTSQPVDLGNVFQSLQAFRTEISGMTDEEEKKKMAAKVALGLVYGLNTNHEMEPEKGVDAGASLEK